MFRYFGARWFHSYPVYYNISSARIGSLPGRNHPMAFQPAESLKNRTFIGLIVAQFLAGFNDQAIHASAMFYAIHQGILTEAKAISWMPILFFAPWAIFCTL